MMTQNKKILLIGPPGAGKTTIKKVYFDKEDPWELFQDTLDPSRGISSNMYSYSDSNLGVFDLAGQENERWLSDKGKNVFSKTSAIFCIFDITNSIESIIEFLIKIYRVKKELNLDSCYINTFLHKIDTANPTYVSHKIKKLKQFIETQHRFRDDIQIFVTSIEKNYFYNTFSIISEILNDLYKEGNIPIKDDNFKLFKENFFRIVGDDTLSDHIIEYKGQKTKYDNSKIGLNLRILEASGLIKRCSKTQYFQLTERAHYFKVGWEKEKIKNSDLNLEEKTNNFHVLLFLDEKAEND